MSNNSTPPSKSHRNHVYMKVWVDDIIAEAYRRGWSDRSNNAHYTPNGHHVTIPLWLTNEDIDLRNDMIARVGIRSSGLSMSRANSMSNTQTSSHLSSDRSHSGILSNAAMVESHSASLTTSPEHRSHFTSAARSPRDAALRRTSSNESPRDVLSRNQMNPSMARRDSNPSGMLSIGMSLARSRNMLMSR